MTTTTQAMIDALKAMRIARNTAIVDDEFPVLIGRADRLMDEALARIEQMEPTSPEQRLVAEILDELNRARTKFPGDNVTMLALMEEVGELAKATFEQSRAHVRKEAVQVAVMAMRVVLDGDATLDGWRKGKRLDALVEQVTA